MLNTQTLLIYVYHNTSKNKKQTYIPKICSIFVLTNACSCIIVISDTEQMFRKVVRVYRRWTSTEEIQMRKYNQNISERANNSLNKREAVVRRQRRAIMFFILVVVSLGI